ncbi:MAG TPA: DUF4321 domain-containing protein [bacterium]|nr:DUF4321 domain-containing protein [bacterium]
MARAAKRTSREPWWILIVVVIAGAMLGSVVADSLGQFTYLAPLGHSVVVGVDPPVTLDLRVITLTLGFVVRLNLATVLGIIAAIYVFRLL